MIRVKKETAVLFFSYFMLTLILGIYGISVIRGAYVNEIRTVQNLAGSVIAEYPETETVFLAALSDRDKKTMETGAEILAHYGYDEREKVKENKSYMRTTIFFGSFLVFFFGLSFFGTYLFYYILAKLRREREERILSVFESFLAGDYRFLSQKEWMDKLGNPWFGDALEKLGKSLRLKEERLIEEHNNIKALVTDISHQLRTPISALKVCFCLYTEAEEEAEKEEFLTRCDVQMNKMETLTEALTNISRLEMHMIRIAPAPVSLIQILTESVNSVYHKAAEKNIEIETVCAEKIELCLDKRWTVEAIANVLDNAVKYSPSGSRIRIRTQKMYQFVRVEIEDNGIGIPREERNLIFARFYRGNSEMVKKEEGTGVGLYLSRKILEKQGGMIFVRPALEQGSVFVIQLPYAQDEN